MPGYWSDADSLPKVFRQWGDDGPFKALVAGSRERGVAVVVFTNGHQGLNVARPVIERVLGRDLEFLDDRVLVTERSRRLIDRHLSPPGTDSV